MSRPRYQIKHNSPPRFWLLGLLVGAPVALLIFWVFVVVVWLI